MSEPIFEIVAWSYGSEGIPLFFYLMPIVILVGIVAIFVLSAAIERWKKRRREAK